MRIERMGIDQYRLKTLLASAEPPDPFQRLHATPSVVTAYAVLERAMATKDDPNAEWDAYHATVDLAKAGLTTY